MTDELTKTFFDTFGIEPRYEDACTVEDEYWNNEELANEYGTFDQYMNCKCGNQENCTTECSCAYQREVYPQISDSILLELICIKNKELISIVQIKGNNLEELKSYILQTCIKGYTKYSNSSLSEYRELADNFKHQVRTLFEEEQDG